MTRLSISLVLAGLLFACGGSTPPSSTPGGGAGSGGEAPAGDGAAGDGDTPAVETGGGSAGVTSCDDACTAYAACWEEVNGGDFHQGGQCVDACEERSDADRAAWFKCIDDAPECKDAVDC